MAKPKARRIPSDDCAVASGGETYYPHEGEWVEIRPVASIAEVRALDGLRRLKVELDAAAGESDEAVRVLSIMDKHFGAVCESLARRMVAWSWTDDNGEPMPQPASQPKVLEQLKGDEILWLMNAAQGESGAARKNE